MKVLKVNRKEKTIKVLPETLDDLWHLENIIEEGDEVKGFTDRKIKPKETGEKPFRVKLFVKLKVESVNFHRYSGQLRISGIILEGKPKEFVEEKAHHTIEARLGKPIEIKKQEIKEFQLQRLKKAENAMHKKAVLVVLMDERKADFFKLHEFEASYLFSIKSMSAGKMFESKEKKNDFFKEVLNKIEETGLSNVLVAGPGFAKDNFQKFLNEVKTKTVFSFLSCSSIGRTGMQELLKRGKLSKAIVDLEIVKETRLVEKVLEEVGKGSKKAEYGLNEIKKAIALGAVETLLVEEKTLLSNRREIEEMMTECEKMKGVVHLIASNHEAGKALHSLGGIAALLRFAIE